MEQNWYIMYNNQQVGPIEKTQLLQYGLNANSQVWHDGMAGWAPAYTVPELMAMLPTAAPETQSFGQPYANAGYQPQPGYGYQQPGYSPVGTNAKSNVAAGILAIFLGGLGIQYFYCGKVAGGFICILLTLVTCGVWDIVSLIQGIIMLTQTPEKFNQTYVYTDKTFPLF